MRPSLIYRSPRLYELVMLALHGRHHLSRHRAVADLIPAGASVVEVCAGPGLLWRRYLKDKRIRYTGLDLNSGFVDQLRRSGAQAQEWDLLLDGELPLAEYVVMQASLYQFLPNASPVIDRMLRAAEVAVIIAEPVRNLTDSNAPVVSTLARWLTRTHRGDHHHRFTERTLDDLVAGYAERVQATLTSPGGREKVVVLRAG
jgi:methionine biosynthesis protein MetW